MRTWALCAVLSALAVGVQAWGAIGHEIVATIAQALLTNDTRTRLCEYLPTTTAYRPDPQSASTHCHLAPIAAWADKVRGIFPWSAPLHYVNAVGDAPPHVCIFGQEGFTHDKHVLTAIPHFTAQLKDGNAAAVNKSLYFLTHLLGDMHQPMHLVGRNQGGNTLPVQFGTQKTTLHSVWDTHLLTRRIQHVHNYTRELPDPTVESALRGRHYDAYVRWILVEGLGVGAESLNAMWPEWKMWPDCPVESMSAGIVTDPPTPCPLFWAQDIHDMACKYAFAPPITQDLTAVMMESFLMPGLPDAHSHIYVEPIDNDWIMEKTLAMAGVRLASLLSRYI